MDLAVAQAEALIEFSSVFSIEDRAAIEVHVSDARAAVSRRERCSIEPVDRDGMKRYLVHNWRRAPGSAAKKILL